MRLQEFVTESLAEIVRGVRDAQKDPDMADAKINPTRLTLGNKITEASMYDYQLGIVAQMIEFDVAVTAEEGKGTKGGIGIFAGAIGLGSQGQSESKNMSVSRLKFKVPLMLPSGK